MSLEPLVDKWRAFGWETRVIDGNDMTQIVRALSSLEPPDSVQRRKPTCFIAKTRKGCGVSFMENDPTWHMGGLDDTGLARALELIEGTRA
jgi:transketolase